MKITNTLKGKSKEICSLLVYVIAATLITSPLAFAASPFQAGQGTVNTKFKSTADYASGCTNHNNTPTSCLNANSYDDLNGVSQGYINVSIYSSDYSYSSISCSGTAYAGIVSINPINGNTTVKATLNPSDPSCSNENWNAGPVTVDLSGTYTNDGNRYSSSGKVTQYFSGGTTYKSDSKEDSFQETFTGSITGFTTPFTGEVSAYRNTRREQVK
ncbi:hypothetical protein [Nostoc sp. ChiVER01]|uniref:hypothetical protein n=1 Tax=Nostoc sp. ChiVER01 TaxID=3075382 RepID=UPI002AD3BF2B|nr:hypothetical protein [Nostoc sp. ChiVER01]MDZ8227830.1 hypothetical protein [Nostoc sp. ChiVER01]